MTHRHGRFLERHWPLMTARGKLKVKRRFFLSEMDFYHKSVCLFMRHIHIRYICTPCGMAIMHNYTEGPMRLGDNLRDTKPPPSLRQWTALLFHSLDWGSMMLVGCSIHCHDSRVEEVQGVRRTKGSHWPRSFQSGDPGPFWPDHLVLAVQARSRSVSWYGETKGPRYNLTASACWASPSDYQAPRAPQTPCLHLLLRSVSGNLIASGQC